MIIKKQDIERILGTHLICYKGRVYRIKENIKDEHFEVNTTDNGISEEHFDEIRQDTISAYNSREYN